VFALTRKRREILYFYLFASPALLGFLVLTIGPMATSAIYSFADPKLTGAIRFVGLQNYHRMFADPLVGHSLLVTAYYTFVGVPIRLLMQLFFAILLNREIRGINIFRSILYLPSIVSGVALALVWMWLLNPAFGLVNYVLWALFHIQGPGWLLDPQWVIPGLIIMSFWQIGPGIIINLAGLQGIPQELYEAGEIDGATGWRRFIRITLPLMSPVLFFNLIMGLVGNFQVFTQAYVMTDGGPSNASLFFVLYLYRNAFQYFKMGYASALAWLLFFVILAMTSVVLKSSPMWVYYEARR